MSWQPQETTSVHLVSEAFGIFHCFLSLPYYHKFQISLVYRPLMFLISTICVFRPFIIGSDLSDETVQNAEKIAPGLTRWFFDLKS